MSSSEFLWALHGILAAIAIFIVLPLGAIKYRVQFLPSWMSHWATQTFGTTLLLIAAGIGLFQSSSIHSDHQVAGLSLVTLLLLQTFLGHCIGGLTNRARLRSWSVATHCVQGFSCFFLGWWAVVTGLRLASFRSTMIILVSLATLTELVAMTFFCSVKRYKAACSTLPKFVINDESDEEMAMHSSEGLS